MDTPAVRPTVDVVDAEGLLLPAVRTLFAEYGAMPHTVGRWQGAAQEIASLPGPYAPPAGALLAALVAGEPVGCVALTRLEPGVCEMKRMYVRPAARGLGVGRALVDAVVARARALGYGTLRLDTAPELAAARALYLASGFHEIPAYHARFDDPVCFERDLTV